MSSTGIGKIRECGSIQELSELWNTHVKEWSQLPTEQARELIRVKDKHKAKLELFEEWSYWYEERAAIAEYDGCLARGNAEDMARETILKQEILQ